MGRTAHGRSSGRGSTLSTDGGLLSSAAKLLWAKTSRERPEAWHPLVLHLLDVAASADAILTREPEGTRERLAGLLGLPWSEGRPWLLLLIACHDLGKASPTFQAKWNKRIQPGLPTPAWLNEAVRHGFVSQMALRELLVELGWSPRLADLAADAVGCHHGTRASERDKDRAERELDVGGRPWREVRAELVEGVRAVLSPGEPPPAKALNGPDFMLLAGLTSFADWIGSAEDWFAFGTPEDTTDLRAWYNRRCAVAESCLDAIAWHQRTPLVERRPSFATVSSHKPRPLHVAVDRILDGIDAPGVLLIEAPMGEGKTEAAFLAHLELQRRFGHRGMYIALPTRATGNAMFERTLAFLQRFGAARVLDIQLVHADAMLNELFTALRPRGATDALDVRAGEWFTSRKRALLSEYGVGTVDQALVPILPVRHNFVRLWGLANRVVVFDEIHAYDDYTGTLLADLVYWLVAMGSSVILLSATLSPGIRRRFAGRLKAEFPESEEPYPRISVIEPGHRVRQVHVPSDASRGIPVTLLPIGSDLGGYRDILDACVPPLAAAVAFVNTVQRAQDLYQSLGEGKPLLDHATRRVGKQLADGTEVILFHARYPADGRLARERTVLERFGPAKPRDCRRILIATQVAEQSLDLDFDVMISDLAPVDILLQRAGRLFRHARRDRPVDGARLLVAGLDGAEPPGFGDPLWWSKVYREDVLLRTWCLLRGRTEMHLPTDIDPLVRAVYEDEVLIPEVIAARMARASAEGEGAAIAHKQEAHLAVIGLPDDASWNDPARYVLYDEDTPGVHPQLRARTRLGRESVTVIPLQPGDAFDPTKAPDYGVARAWYLRSVSLSRPSVVREVKRGGVPQGWETTPLLRGCYPMVLTDSGRWASAPAIRLDADLGVVYEKMETT